MLSPKANPTAEDLRRNILSTYFFIRTGIVTMSLLLPTGIFAYTLSAEKKALRGDLEYRLDADGFVETGGGTIKLINQAAQPKPPNQ